MMLEFILELLKRYGKRYGLCVLIAFIVFFLSAWLIVHLVAERGEKVKIGPIEYTKCKPQPIRGQRDIGSVQPPSSPSSTSREVVPQIIPCTKGSLFKVPAKPKDWRVDVLTPTAIQVEDGDTISFSASGTWDVGLGPTGPNGQDDWCECTVSERSGAGFRGPVGALIGRIGEQGEPFLIGSKNTITAVGSGTLFLGSNDNLGPCDKVSIGSCYDDNKGNIEVCVEVK